MYLHEEAGQQSSFDVVGVGLSSKGGFGDGKLDPVQGVSQLWSDGLGCLQGGVIQEMVLTPLLSTEVWNITVKQYFGKFRHVLKLKNMTRVSLKTTFKLTLILLEVLKCLLQYIHFVRLV